MYNTVYADMKTDKWNQIQYQTLFLMRRLSFGIFMILFADYPILQVFNFTLFSVLTIAHQLVTSPFVEKKMNLMATFNEIHVGFLGCLIFFFVTPLNNYTIISVVGYIMMSLVVYINAVNMIVAIVLFILSLITALP